MENNGYSRNCIFINYSNHYYFYFNAIRSSSLIVGGALIALLLGSKNGFKAIFLALIPFVCFVYYWLLLFFIKKQEKKNNISVLLLVAFLILLTVPIVWMIVDFESFYLFVHYPWQKYFEYEKALRII